MKIAFVTNLCAHYRIRTFEALGQEHNVTYFFFSAGDEWYWEQKHGTNVGNFQFKQLRGIRIGKTRFTLTLPYNLVKYRGDVYIKCINGKFALPITYIIARLLRKPFILWTGIWMRLNTPFHRAFFPIVRYIYRHSDAIVVYGEHVKEYLVSEGVRPNRIFVTNHAIENSAYNRYVSIGETDTLRNDLDISSDQSVLLSLGRLVPEKGLDILIKAFAYLQLDDVVLVIVGSGRDEPRLLELVKRYGITGRVRFVGYVPTDQTIPYYAIADAFVIPSITTNTFKEPWGLTVNEAFNQGVPVVATDAVGAAMGGLIENGINGYIIPERDVQALLDALHKLLSDSELRVTMSTNAKEKIDHWDNDLMVKGFLDAIASVQD